MTTLTDRSTGEQWPEPPRSHVTESGKVSIQRVDVVEKRGAFLRIGRLVEKALGLGGRRERS